MVMDSDTYYSEVVNSIGFNTVEFGESGRTVNGKAIGGRTTKPAYKRNLLEEGLLSHLTSIELLAFQ